MQRLEQLYHSNYRKSRGAAVLVNKKISFIMQTVTTNHQGRCVVVTGTMFNIPETLANVDVPTGDDAQFLKTFLSWLPNLKHTQVYSRG